MAQDLPAAESPYYIKDGLRRVHPYYYTYRTSCKERWRGRTLLDVFQDEFRERSAEYYVCETECRILLVT